MKIKRKRPVTAARKINFLITVTNTDEIIDVLDDQDAAIEVARQYTQKWGDSATVEKQYISSDGETFDSVVVYQTDDSSIEMYAVVDGHTIVGDLYDTYNEALSAAKQFVNNANGVVRVLALDCIVTDDDIYYGESVEDGRVLWSSDGTLEGDGFIYSSAKTAKRRIVSNSDVYTLRMNGANGNLSEPMEFDNVKDAVSYASSCDIYNFYTIKDASGNVIKRGRCNTKKMANRPIKATAGSDPYKLIKEHKDAFVDGWASEYEGDPETSWDNIFDNVLEEFRTYCGDEASDFIIDEYNEGRYTEGDMMSAFEQFIMFLDISAYDE